MPLSMYPGYLGLDAFVNISLEAKCGFMTFLSRVSWTFIASY
jgi:hypothetical protein